MNAPKPSETAPSERELLTALKQLSTEVEHLNKHRFIALHNSPLRLIGFQFMRGLAFGLGSVIGATILVSLLGWWVSQFEFIPIIGEWAVQIMDQIQAPQ